MSGRDTSRHFSAVQQFQSELRLSVASSCCADQPCVVPIRRERGHRRNFAPQAALCRWRVESQGIFCGGERDRPRCQGGGDVV